MASGDLEGVDVVYNIVTDDIHLCLKYENCIIDIEEDSIVSWHKNKAIDYIETPCKHDSLSFTKSYSLDAYVLKQLLDSAFKEGKKAQEKETQEQLQKIFGVK